jgi:hypothetical protein
MTPSDPTWLQKCFSGTLLTSKSDYLQRALLKKMNETIVTDRRALSW